MLVTLPQHRIESCSQETDYSVPYLVQRVVGFGKELELHSSALCSECITTASTIATTKCLMFILFIHGTVHRGIVNVFRFAFKQQGTRQGVLHPWRHQQTTK